MIRLEHLAKGFGGPPVVRDLSMDLPSGRVTVLMGPNGSGKTTVMNLVLGLLSPDAGRIVGADGLTRAAVFQEDRLCEHLSAVSNVRLAARREIDNRDILAELAAVGLDADSATRPVEHLSGGQRRRVCLARAMIARADLVCLDEPFQGIDADTKEAAMRFVRERTQGKPVLLITHDPDEAEWFAGTVIRLPA